MDFSLFSLFLMLAVVFSLFSKTSKDLLFGSPIWSLNSFWALRKIGSKSEYKKKTKMWEIHIRFSFFPKISPEMFMGFKYAFLTLSELGERSFWNRSSKTLKNEWFSRTTSIMKNDQILAKFQSNVSPSSEGVERAVKTQWKLQIFSTRKIRVPIANNKNHFGRWYAYSKSVLLISLKDLSRKPDGVQSSIS